MGSRTVTRGSDGREAEIAQQFTNLISCTFFLTGLLRTEKNKEGESDATIKMERARLLLTNALSTYGQKWGDSTYLVEHHDTQLPLLRKEELRRVDLLAEDTISQQAMNIVSRLQVNQSLTYAAESSMWTNTAILWGLEASASPLSVTYD